jgi:hypothetical protein
VTLLAAGGHVGTGEAYVVGEPTVATINGQKYLYFVYFEGRANGAISGIADLNGEVGFVPIP